MTIHKAIEEIRKVGSVQAHDGKLKVRIPEPERIRLEPAIEELRRNRQAALDAICNEATIPPSEGWPESLRKLAEERVVALGDSEAARREVWLSWAEWTARRLNELFLEQGLTGEAGGITAATVRHGERKRQTKLGESGPGRQE